MKTPLKAGTGNNHGDADAADALAISLTPLFFADPLKAHMMERKYI